MLRLLFPYLLFGCVVAVVGIERFGGGAADPAEGSGARMEAARPGEAVGRDPVCQMDVGDRVSAVHAGERFHFCSTMCRATFLEAPALYAAEKCLVCRVDHDELRVVDSAAPAFTWQQTTYRFCGLEHRDRFASDAPGYFVHSMWGIPPWLYAISVGLVLVLSFGLFEWLSRSVKRPRESARLDLFRIPGLGALVRWPHLRTLAQLSVLAVFVLIVLAGLYGSQLASRNIAPLLTWTIWWGGLVVLIMFAGKAWCYVCPWDAIAGWVERIAFWRRKWGSAWDSRGRAGCATSGSRRSSSSA